MCSSHTSLSSYSSISSNSILALLPIVTGSTSPVLRAPTERIPKVTKEVKKLIKDMQETVRDANGLGLAAPQIDRSLRLCLVMMNGKITPLINPDITWKGEEVDTAEEGCLSLPGVYKKVDRPVQIKVQYLDESGKEQERILKGMDARVVQHEVDHLEGVLIVDY